MVLIFTNKCDAHPTPVIGILESRKEPFFRFNTECLLTDYEFSWWCEEKKGSDFYIKNTKNGSICYGHEVSAIWDRRPLSPNLLPVTHLNSEINDHILAEANVFLSFLRYYLKDVFSIGSIVEDRPASSKMLQMAIALSLGMRVPDTCISNRKTDICELTTANNPLIIKPLSAGSVLVSEADREYVFYSQKIESNVLLEQPDSSFSQTACFVQKYIEKKYEVRVTAVCDKVVACKIDSQKMLEDQGKVDWRQGLDFGLSYEKIELPQSVREFCVKFLKKIRLNFGCFDFIVTPSDEFVFLECNPNGQWLWIENETNCGISEMIVDALLSKKNV